MTPAYSYNFLKEKLDITTLADSDADYSPVTVGGLTNGTKLEELVGAYMIFGNGGKKYDVTYVSKVEDADGNAIYEKSDGYKQAISESTAYVMNRMMQNVITQQDGTGRYAKLNNTDLVGKTGTSSDWFDLSFVGCTPDYVSGIWIGYETLPLSLRTSIRISVRFGRTFLVISLRMRSISHLTRLSKCLIQLKSSPTAQRQVSLRQIHAIARQLDITRSPTSLSIVAEIIKIKASITLWRLF